MATFKGLIVSIVLTFLIGYGIYQSGTGQTTEIPTLQEDAFFTIIELREETQYRTSDYVFTLSYTEGVTVDGIAYEYLISSSNVTFYNGVSDHVLSDDEVIRLIIDNSGKKIKSGDFALEFLLINAFVFCCSFLMFKKFLCGWKA